MPPKTAEPDYLTVPQLSVRLSVGLDRLRKLLKKHPELKPLFKTFGGTRVLAVADVERVRAAVCGENAPAR